MRFPEPVRMADDGDHGPVWARRSRRSSGNPLIGLLVTLLALFGAVTLVMSIKERSISAGGAVMDGWVSGAWNGVRSLAGQAPEAAEKAADEAGVAAAKTGDALQAGARSAADEIKKS